MPAPAPFWKTKTLEEMSHEEWESLCDGCGRCCLHKLRDNATDALAFTNVALTFTGGLTTTPASPPEATPNQYPESNMFGDLPGLAVYARHVDGLTLSNIKVHAGQPDGRPGIVLDEVTAAEISAFDSTNIPPHQPLVLFRNVAGALLSGNRAPAATDVFLRVTGDRSSGVALRGNDLRLARKALEQSSEVPRDAVSPE